MRARITTEPDGGLCLETSYQAAFVQALKTAIPWDRRTWDAARKRWSVSVLYADDLLRLLTDFHATVFDERCPHHEEALTVVPPMPPELRDAFDALFLAYTAPLCVAVAAYRALSQIHHPDHGGEAHQFRTVQTAIATIRQYLDPPTEESTTR